MKTKQLLKKKLTINGKKVQNMWKNKKKLKHYKYTCTYIYKCIYILKVLPVIVVSYPLFVVHITVKLICALLLHRISIGATT